jgi:MoxR-like ATPase
MEFVDASGVQLRLSPNDELKMNWVGNQDAMTQLIAAWTVLDEADIPLNPRILGKPGCGKTTLAYSAAKIVCPEKVYIYQCTMDTRPEDLIIQPVIGPDNKIAYHASPLITAMIKGGICILDEGNRMSEKSWASLAPLLDKRRYVESILAGIKINAHKDFRLCVTMNTDSSTYEIPEYIDSRLQPKIFLDFPGMKDEFAILKYNLPFADDKLIEYIVQFLQSAHNEDKPYSVRDGINIATYYLKLINLDASRFSINSLNSSGQNQSILNQKPRPKSKTSSFTLDLDNFILSMGQILGEEAIEFWDKKSKEKDKKGKTESRDPNKFPASDDDSENEEDDEGFDGFEDILDDDIDYEDEDDTDEDDEDDFESQDDDDSETFDDEDIDGEDLESEDGSSLEKDEHNPMKRSKMKDKGDLFDNGKKREGGIFDPSNMSEIKFGNKKRRKDFDHDANSNEEFLSFDDKTPRKNKIDSEDSDSNDSKDKNKYIDHLRNKIRDNLKSLDNSLDDAKTGSLSEKTPSKKSSKAKKSSKS